MKILIAVDDSAHSQAAVRFVRETAWPAGSTVLVVSAVPTPMAAYTMMDAGAATAVHDLEVRVARAHEELAARVERELQQARLDVSSRVLPGDPRDVIVRVAQMERADLVVLGSHGRTGLSRLMMGSVASHVVTHAPCHVLVVKTPKPAATLAAGALAGAGSRPD